MKKTFLIILFSLIVFAPVFAQTDDKPTLYFFGSPTCPHCIAERAFLDKLEAECAQVEILRYDFSENIELAKDLYGQYGVSAQEQGFVPITFIGDKYFIGFNDKIGQNIEDYILELTGEKNPEEECVPAIPEETPAEQLPEQSVAEIREEIIEIPFLGKIDLKNFSLPVLAVLLGTLDGFNICSLGALVLILGLVLTLRSKKSILAFGGIFVLTTIIVYGLLVFLWHQVFVFIAPFIKRMELLIGILALAGAFYFLKEFFKVRKHGAACQFGGISEKMSARIKKRFEKKAGILALIGAVLVFAAMVTIIEFPCSAFFPVVFTGILAEANIPLSLSLLYIGLYVFFYMLDELVILLLAVITMKIWVASPKIVIFLNLFASLLLLFLGLHYLMGFF